MRIKFSSFADNSQNLVDADQDKRGQEVNAEGTSMTSDDARYIKCLAERTK
jgi:hypothetical protein